MLGYNQRPSGNHLTCSRANNRRTEYSPALVRNNLNVTFGLAFRLRAVVLVVGPTQDAD
jgi:hypothetical protein